MLDRLIERMVEEGYLKMDAPPQMPAGHQAVTGPGGIARAAALSSTPQSARVWKVRLSVATTATYSPVCAARILARVAAEPTFQTDWATSLYMDIASDSMLAARTDIAGSRIRDEKSSSDRVRSTEVKLRSTPRSHVPNGTRQPAAPAWTPWWTAWASRAGSYRCDRCGGEAA